jgi:hypothetical protein
VYFFAIAVGRATSDGYEVEVYSAENVAAFVAVAREKYFRWRVVNSPESGRQERTNLHQNFDAYNPAQVERKILRLAKGDIRCILLKYETVFFFQTVFSSLSPDGLF